MLIEHTIEGRLRLTGSIELRTNKQLDAILDFKQSLDILELTVLVINRTLYLSGSINKQTRKFMKPSFLTFKGDITKKAMLTSNALVSFSSLLRSEKNPVLSGFRRTINWMRRGHH